MDPNVWAVLSGVFTMIALSHTMLVRTLRGEVKRLDQKVDMKVDGLETQLTNKIDSVEEQLTDKINNVETQLTNKINGLETQLTDKINNVDGKSEARGESLGTVLRVQFGAIDKRLGAIEEDMLLVKAHLLGVSRAS